MCFGVCVCVCACQMTSVLYSMLVSSQFQQLEVTGATLDVVSEDRRRTIQLISWLSLHQLVSSLQHTPRPTGETSQTHSALRKDNPLLT